MKKHYYLLATTLAFLSIIFLGNKALAVVIPGYDIQLYENSHRVNDNSVIIKVKGYWLGFNACEEGVCYARVDEFPVVFYKIDHSVMTRDEWAINEMRKRGCSDEEIDKVNLRPKDWKNRKECIVPNMDDNYRTIYLTNLINNAVYKVTLDKPPIKTAVEYGPQTTLFDFDLKTHRASATKTIVNLIKTNYLLIFLSLAAFIGVVGSVFYFIGKKSRLRK